MKAIVLDEWGDNRVPDGHTVVENEVALLAALAGPTTIVLVRGHSLCRWAAEVSTSRGWSCQRLSSPVDELVRAVPGLSQQDARQIIESLGASISTLSRPISAKEIAAKIFPGFGCWTASIGPIHASRWLQWMCQRQLAPHLEILLNAVSEQWAAQSPALHDLYMAGSGSGAWGCLKRFLRITGVDVSLPLFPDEPLDEDISRRVYSELVERALETQGAFFEGLASRGAGTEILKLAARAAAAFYWNNPRDLSLAALDSLGPYLSEEEYWQLREHLPPVDPGNPPEDAGEVLEWFRNRYLAFRRWAERSGAESDRERVRVIARRFGEWYLKAFVQARTGGEAASLLSWGRAARLTRDEPGKITLLLVLDGLSYPDAKRFVSLVGFKSRRLALDRMDAVFGPLPTTTEFAKPALFTGVTPSLALFEDRELGSVHSEDQDVIHALCEVPDGGVVIWSLLEPDKTYHWSGEGHRALDEVELRLQSLAGRLASVANAVPASRRLRVVVSTDHGRLLGVARRRHPVPAGMSAHGRAAWGPTSKTFGMEGYLIEGDLAYLHPERFGIPHPAAVLLDDAAFVMADGREGDEAYPHGGVYPEEVLVPWAELSRDRTPFRLSARGTGKAPAGTAGRIAIAVENPGQVSVTVCELSLSFLESPVVFNTPVGAMKIVELTVEIPNWPTAGVLRDAHATLAWLLPDGGRDACQIELALESEEMYVRTDILGSLGGLE